jgi:transcription initiation factor IIE alpha subunit
MCPECGEPLVLYDAKKEIELMKKDIESLKKSMDNYV